MLAMNYPKVISSDNQSSHSSEDGDLSQARRKKTREELNVLEKHRMNRISQQIKHLHVVLQGSGISCKKSKQAILHATTKYIEDLEKELKEVRRRNNTLQQEVESSKQDNMPPHIFGLMGDSGADVRPMVNDVDYSLLFDEASLAMAVSGLDGRFLRCNRAFCEMSGFLHDELKNFSFFNLTPPEEIQGLYAVVNSMFTDKAKNPQQFWKECNMKAGKILVYVTMSLIRDRHDQPKYFHCVLVPVPDPQGIAKAISGTQSSQTIPTPVPIQQSHLQESAMPALAEDLESILFDGL